MSKDVSIVDPEEVGFTKNQIDIIRRTVAPDLNDVELAMFLHNAKRMRLDPMAKQIHAIKRFTKKGEVVTIQIGIDGFRLVAERTNKYSPGKDTEFIYGNNGKLVGAKVFIKKLVGNVWHDISATALIDEYKGKSPLWQSMPHVMIEKCAEARALRRGFPADLSGVYSFEEMEQASNASDELLPKAEVAEVEIIDNAISDEQLRELMDAIGDDKTLFNRVESFIKGEFGVSSLSEMPSTYFKTALNRVNASKGVAQ